MSEPSLRDTIAEAIGQYWPQKGDEDWQCMAADAALRVIHSQRDAIIQAIAAHSDYDDGWAEQADAVLAVLGAPDD